MLSTIEKPTMKKITYCWMAAALLGGMLFYYATVLLHNRTWRGFLKFSPVIEYPATLDLGEHEIGDIVAVPFTIANRGGGELLIDEITSNCGCTGIEREENGRYLSLQSLRLKSGEQANLAMRVSVGGVPLGSRMGNFVEFRTNDPGQLTGQIEVVVTRVHGGVFTTPEFVVFGTVPVGSRVHQIVEIRDPVVPPRKINRVFITGSDQITVRLLPDTELPKKGEKQSHGIVVGRLEVDFEAKSSSNIDAAVHIEVEGREGKPDQLPVIGKVAALFQMSPSVIVLPRSTNQGPVYSATCICRSITGKPVTMTVDSAPKGVTAQILPESAAGERTIKIVCDPKSTGDNVRGQRQIIRFRAKDGENEAVVELPIILQK